MGMVLCCHSNLVCVLFLPLGNFYFHFFYLSPFFFFAQLLFGEAVCDDRDEENLVRRSVDRSHVQACTK